MPTYSTAALIAADCLDVATLHDDLVSLWFPVDKPGLSEEDFDAIDEVTADLYAYLIARVQPIEE
jgi:hypothetical protein